MTRKIFVAVVIGCSIALILPITLYIYKFGFGLWDKHSDWALMGSYFGGVVGPIITSISIVFLGYQLREQLIQRKSENLEKDILHLIPKLSDALREESFNSALRISALLYKEKIASDDSEGAKEVINNLVESYFKQFNIWLSVDSNYRELAKVNFPRYKNVSLYLLSECELEDLFT
ncbi:hypothetical protein CXF80_18110 [Shewanella sp. Actino-trap-3]|uniref:hypothetical protein n=1 Tax=Shewanella sp. Actino-trap-3 TaxID=2058331 RepID=UPI000C32C83C|nr:hypothetical protein [Shewanella sp. Actino-trap-3]PKG80057.1 hypothetical protein CXF80_18110 [Shewanella sp. Actino-trap-3]